MNQKRVTLPTFYAGRIAKILGPLVEALPRAAFHHVSFLAKLRGPAHRASFVTLCSNKRSHHA